MSLISKKSVGLDISDKSIEVIKLQGRGESIKIAGINRIKIPPGIINRGRIKDEKKLLSIIKKLLLSAKPTPIIDKTINFALPDSQVFMHHFVINYKKRAINRLNDEEREEIVSSEAKKNIPIPTEDLNYNYKILGRTKEKEYILIVATREKIINEWYSLFKKAGLHVERFDIEPFAQYRSLFRKKQEKPVCIVDIGDRTTDINIFNKKGLMVNYTFQKAGDHLTRVISKELGIDLEKAEIQKINSDILNGNKIANIVIKAMQPILKEILNSLDYYKKIFKEEVEKIILIGGTANINGIREYLQENLGKTVELGKLDLTGKKAVSLYIESLGLALGGINKALEKEKLYFPIQNKKIKRNNDKVITKEKQYIFRENGGDSELALKSKIKIFIIIIIIGAVLIGASFWYRSNKKAEKEEAQKRALEAIDLIVVKKDKYEQLDKRSTTTKEILDNMEGDISTSTIEEDEEKTILPQVLIKNTPTGWLNVRTGPGISYPILNKIYPGESYGLVKEEGDWSEIILKNNDKGWVINTYVQKEEL